MRNKWFLFILLFSVILIAASCQKEKRSFKPLELAEIIGQEAFIKDKFSLDLDGDNQDEILVLYVLDKETDNVLQCDVPEERLLGKFYLGLVSNYELVSKIELLMDSLENKDKAIIKLEDLNGDARELEMAFISYASCSGNYVEVVGIEQKELVRYNFYQEEEIVDELFVSSDLKWEQGHLIQEYSSDEGDFQNYYSFSEEKKGFDLIKRISD